MTFIEDCGAIEPTVRPRYVLKPTPKEGHVAKVHPGDGSSKWQILNWWTSKKSREECSSLVSLTTLGKETVDRRQRRRDNYGPGGGIRHEELAALFSWGGQRMNQPC